MPDFLVLYGRIGGTYGRIRSMIGGIIERIWNVSATAKQTLTPTGGNS